MRLSELSAAKKAAKQSVGDIESTVRLLVNLSEMRREKLLTIYECAKECGLTNSTFMRIESGESPRLATALILAKFYELPVESIWELKEGK